MNSEAAGWADPARPPPAALHNNHAAPPAERRTTSGSLSGSAEPRFQDQAAAPPPRKKAKVGQLSSDSVHRSPRPQPQRAARPAAEPWAGGAVAASGSSDGSARRFRCDWEGCSYESTGSGHMKRHVRTHTGERPYVCSWEGCTYSAAQSVHLVQHMRSHTGEREFEPPFGGTAPAAPSPALCSASTHGASRTVDPGPFKCAVVGCNYAASRSGHLKRHMRVHSNQAGQAQQQAGARAAPAAPGNGFLSETNPEEKAMLRRRREAADRAAAEDLAAAAATLLGAAIPDPAEQGEINVMTAGSSGGTAAEALDQVANAAAEAAVAEVAEVAEAGAARAGQPESAEAG